MRATERHRLGREGQLPEFLDSPWSVSLQLLLRLQAERWEGRRGEALHFSGGFKLNRREMIDPTATYWSMCVRHAGWFASKTSPRAQWEGGPA